MTSNTDTKERNTMDLGYDGFALILTSEQYMTLCKKRHPNQKVEDEHDLVGLNEDIQNYNDGNCSNFCVQTPNNSYWLTKLAKKMDDFGSAIEKEEANGELDIDKNTVWAMFAPRSPDYFEAPYEDLDELLDDIAKSSCLFEDASGEISDENRRFVRDHVAYLDVVTYE